MGRTRVSSSVASQREVWSSGDDNNNNNDSVLEDGNESSVATAVSLSSTTVDGHGVRLRGGGGWISEAKGKSTKTSRSKKAQLESGSLSSSSSSDSDSDSGSLHSSTASAAQSSSSSRHFQATNDARQELINEARSSSWSLRGSIEFTIKYLAKNTVRDLNAWAIGVLTIFLVVMFLSIMQNNIVKSPLVFLRLAEVNAGESDMIMTAQRSVDVTFPALNWTDLDRKMNESADLVTGSAPRWYVLADVFNRDRPEFNASAIVIVHDSQLEIDIGLGRSFDHRALGEAEVHVTSTLLRTLDLKPNVGDRLQFGISAATLLGLFGGGGLGSGLSLGGLNSLNVTSYLSGGLTSSVLGSAVIDGDTITIPVNNQTAPLIFALLGLDTGVLTVDQQLAVLEALGVGDSITVDLGTVQDFLGVNLANNGTVDLAITADVAVIDSIAKPSGKYPSQLGNVVLVDVDYFERLIKDQAIAFVEGPLYPFLQNVTGLTAEEALVAIEDFSLREYALTIGVMYKERENAYKREGDALQEYMRDFSTNVMEAIGFDAKLDITYPVASGLAATTFIRLFLDQLFLAVTIILVFLGCMLIYSLLLSDVEDKTYEYGMLRALGMRHGTLIQILVGQSLIFAVPGVLLGWLAAFIINIPIAFFINSYVNVTLDVSLTGRALIYTLVIGLVMPLVSNYLPIKRALSKTLRDSLDLYHQVVSDTTVTVIRLESLGISAWQTAISVMLVVFGFVTYYLIPLSFTFGNLGMFFSILICILIGMVFGLALMATILQPKLELVVLWLLLWGRDKRLGILVRKSLQGHRARNKKTALMFTVSLAFMVFAGTQFLLFIALINSNLETAFGADIVIFYPSDLDDLSQGLDEVNMRATLERASSGGPQEFNSLVKAFTFMTHEFGNLPRISGVDLGNLPQLDTIGVNIYGIEPDYLQATYNDYIIFHEVDEDFEYKDVGGSPNVVLSLYEGAGEARLPVDELISGPPPLAYSETVAPWLGCEDLEEARTRTYTRYLDAIVSEGMRYNLGIDIDSPLLLQFYAEPAEGFGLAPDVCLKDYALIKTRGLVSKLPGFFYSSYRQLAFGSAVLVSLDSFQELLVQAHGGDTVLEVPETVAKGSLYVLAKDDSTVFDRETIMNALRSFIDRDDTFVLDVINLIESASTTTDLMLLFFNVVAIIAALLSFFVLLLSFTANMRENAWEFGVLRALGLSGFAVLRSYIYEALTLVLTSILLGFITGVLTSITLTLQFLIFTEFPFKMNFPYTLFFSVCGMSIVLAVLGSYLPSRAVLKKQIASAVKGL